MTLADRLDQILSQHEARLIARLGEPVIALEKSLNLAVMTLAFIGRDQGSSRIDATLDGLCKLAAEADPIIRDALAAITDALKGE